MKQDTLECTCERAGRPAWYLYLGTALGEIEQVNVWSPLEILPVWGCVFHGGESHGEYGSYLFGSLERAKQAALLAIQGRRDSTLKELARLAEVEASLKS